MLSFSRFNKYFPIIKLTADISVTSVIETYKLRPKYKLCFPSRVFWKATLGANVVANNLFLPFLFRYFAFGVLFLKDVGLIRSSMLCSKCGYQMFWCVIVRTFTDGDVGGSHTLPRQSGAVHGFSRVTSIP